MSGEPKSLTPQRFQHRHPVEAIRFTGTNALEVYRFLGWEKAGDIVRRDNKEGVIRLGLTPDLRTGDWLVRRPQPLHAHSGYPRPGRYVAYSDEDFHATFDVGGVPVVARDEAAEHKRGPHWEEIYKKSWEEARDEAAELRAENAELRAAGHQSVRLIEWLSSREGTALEDAAEAEALVNRLRAALAASEGES